MLHYVFFSKTIKRVVSNKDRVGGKIVFEIIGVWTCLLETLEYTKKKKYPDDFHFMKQNNHFWEGKKASKYDAKSTIFS